MIIQLDDNTSLEIKGNEARIIKNDTPGSWHQFTIEPAVVIVDVTKSDPGRVIITYNNDKATVASIIDTYISFS